jgi:rhamnopyranosyl-N-acetylglucosaminyl-diphospho-decaprenol beta-1,3/1,4-galactofuranosyltransferase
MTEKLCVVVVTYNRKTLLARCLNALLGQTRLPDQILVVNNASTDGTAALLCQEFPQVAVLNLPKNIGGAGGYHTGLAWASQRDFDWISLMDDDGQPTPTCLEALLNGSDSSLRVRAPLVLSEADPSRLAFRLYWQGQTIITRVQAEQVAQNGLLWAYINPFNGLLLAREVVEKIGLPEKGMFLWGDDYEYFLRIKCAGINLATVVKAHFYHPPDRMQFGQVRLLFKTLPVYYANDPFKDYLIVRNQAYILKKYRGWPGWVAHVLRHLIFYGQQARYKEFPNVLTAAWHGARADFSHHQKFLP